MDQISEQMAEANKLEAQALNTQAPQEGVQETEKVFVQDEEHVGGDPVTVH